LLVGPRLERTVDRVRCMPFAAQQAADRDGLRGGFLDLDIGLESEVDCLRGVVLVIDPDGDRGVPAQ
jgi:hypothetical protein